MDDIMRFLFSNYAQKYFHSSHNFAYHYSKTLVCWSSDFTWKKG